MIKKHWKFATFAYAFALLSGCADDVSQFTNSTPTIPLERVLNQCLAAATPPGEPTLAPDSLTESQWVTYVTCAIGSNLRVDIDQARENPDAIVEVQLDDDGDINSLKLLGTSGNVAWDRAVNHSIAATPALSPAPAARHFSKLDLHFRPLPQGLGMGGSAILTGQSPSPVQQCISVLHGPVPCR
ncbi:TonB C-terminal domain-containing protein [Paraburkholderia phenazinium]|uniref:TonB C-terminal domain-containing protein n=1 Tax=Paraburkholderia phenazinium TaxID=60549 RepID=UPI00158B6DDB|nr:TonB C-terminal domain-containing protein [Paraburkholderia phenazinium]